MFSGSLINEAWPIIILRDLRASLNYERWQNYTDERRVSVVHASTRVCVSRNRDAINNVRAIWKSKFKAQLFKLTEVSGGLSMIRGRSCGWRGVAAAIVRRVLYFDRVYLRLHVAEVMQYGRWNQTHTCIQITITLRSSSIPALNFSLLFCFCAENLTRKRNQKNARPKLGCTALFSARPCEPGKSYQRTHKTTAIFNYHTNRFPIFKPQLKRN